MVGAVDFSYFDESPMAARARLAGFGDARTDAVGDGHTRLRGPHHPGGRGHDPKGAPRKAREEASSMLLLGICSCERRATDMSTPFTPRQESQRSFFPDPRSDTGGGNVSS